MQYIGQIEFDGAVAGVLLFTEFHQGREFFRQLVQRIVGAGGPVVVLLSILNEDRLSGNHMHGKGQFTDLFHKPFFQGCKLCFFSTQEGQ